MQQRTLEASLLGWVRCLAGRLVPLPLGFSVFVSFLRRLMMGSSSESSSSLLSSSLTSSFFLFLVGCSACSVTSKFSHHNDCCSVQPEFPAVRLPALRAFRPTAWLVVLPPASWPDRGTLPGVQSRQTNLAAECRHRPPREAEENDGTTGMTGVLLCTLKTCCSEQCMASGHVAGLVLRNGQRLTPGSSMRQHGTQCGAHLLALQLLLSWHGPILARLLLRLLRQIWLLRSGDWCLAIWL